MADRLSGLDSSFLHLERDGTHMHVASTTLFEGPAPPYIAFRDHISSRLHLVPRFRQKLRFVPLGQGRPVWVDDPYLNLDYHVGLRIANSKRFPRWYPNSEFRAPRRASSSAGD